MSFYCAMVHSQQAWLDEEDEREDGLASTGIFPSLPNPFPPLPFLRTLAVDKAYAPTAVERCQQQLHRRRLIPTAKKPDTCIAKIIINISSLLVKFRGEGENNQDPTR
jgi:hypothetical protein